MTHAADPPVITVVCHANVCRSPLTAALLQRRLDIEGLSIRVQSRGTQVAVGRGVDEPTLTVGQSLGVDLSSHVARALTSDDVAESSLVLTAERAQRSEVVSLYPRALRYSFTLRQLSRILQGAAAEETTAAVDPDRAIGTLLGVVQRERGQHFVVAPEQDDVPDPYGQHDSAYRRSASLISEAVDTIADVLLDASGVRPGQLSAG